MTAKQTRFLRELLRCSTVSEAIANSNISSSTAYSWLADAEFQQELTRCKAQMLTPVVLQMQMGLSDGVQTLLDIIRNPDSSPQIKINATDSLFRNCRPLMQDLDIMGRISALESKLKEGEELDD